jgi:hypothetical protein
MNRYTPTMIWLVMCLVFVLFNWRCTNSPSGAIEYNTTIYYLDGKFHEEIPEEYIFKTWGYRITDGIGKEHTYREVINISHQRKENRYCTIHRRWEVIKAMYNGKEYLYWVSNHRKG